MHFFGFCNCVSDQTWMQSQTISHKLKRIVDLYNPEDPYETLSKIVNTTKARTTLNTRPDDYDVDQIQALSSCLELNE